MSPSCVLRRARLPPSPRSAAAGENSTQAPLPPHAWLVWRLLKIGIMEPSAPANAPTEGADVTFSCERCGAPLVVDGAAAGLTLNCQRCGGPTTVPHPSAPDRPEGAPREEGAPLTIEERLAELRRHLKENESQRTEVNGYINQLSIQLHRWQLRMQTLDERNRELMAEVVKCVTAASRGPQK